MKTYTLSLIISYQPAYVTSKDYFSFRFFLVCSNVIVYKFYNANIDFEIERKIKMNTKEFLAKFKNDLEKMKAQANATTSGFAGLFSKTMAESVLTVKQKELIAIGIAVSIQCEPCIKLHVQKCLGAGVTREEILEAVGVSVMMSGGPAYTHIPMVIEALDDLES